MHEIFAIQHYNGTIWHTIYLSSFPSDVLDTFLDLTQATQASLRLVVFTVDNYDFIATHARGFSVPVRTTSDTC